jgi:hypothetical protein
MIAVDAHFRPFKREPLLKEALPSANPPVRLVQGKHWVGAVGPTGF